MAVNKCQAISGPPYLICINIFSEQKSTYHQIHSNSTCIPNVKSYRSFKNYFSGDWTSVYGNWAFISYELSNPKPRAVKSFYKRDHGICKLTCSDGCFVLLYSFGFVSLSVVSCKLVSSSYIFHLFLAKLDKDNVVDI